MSKVTTIKLAGPAGLGIKSGGQLISQVLIAHGQNVIDYSEYPSLVRGGHNTYQVSFSSDKIFAPYCHVDLFFALSPGHDQQHTAEFDQNTQIFKEDNLPLRQLSQQVGHPLAGNTICLGVTAHIFNLDPAICHQTITSFFGPTAADLNLKAFDLGLAYAQEHFAKSKIDIDLSKNNLSPNLIDGNEAFGWGFLRGEGDFYAAYPMTPSTGTLHFLAKQQGIYPIKVIHAEDEIAVANMAAGAAYAGARAAIGTSGGGFALMNEAVSFCGIAEIGVVFYLVSRPGPATGMPTWTSQGDLLHAVFSGHGEFPKVVLAPGDQQESFDFAHLSLNLAATLQTPIIVLSDKTIGESATNLSQLSTIKVEVDRSQVITQPASGYQRYDWNSDTGLSGYTLPGTIGGQYLSNSYEHDPAGFSTEDLTVAPQMADKRDRKIATAQKLTPQPAVYGNPNSQSLIISWGSPKGAILEALKVLPDFAFLQVKTVWPLHSEIESIVKKYSETILIENNHYAQLGTLLKTKFNFQPTHTILKYSGQPFFPEELIEKLKSL